MKKVLSLLLAVLMVFTLLPVSALADGEQLTIRASSVTALVASEIEVEISAENNPGISGLQLQLEYDSSVLTLEEVNYADAATTGLIAQPSQKLESPVKLTWYNGTADSKYNGALATLRFSVSENAAEGSGSTLHLVIDGDNVSNLKEENIPFLAVDGEILIINYTPGDINNDQRVNVKDLIRLAQYLADWEVEVVDACLDTNGDGSINIKDLIRLAQYLADWEVELFPKAATSTCEHVLSAVEAKAATCVDEGNTAYWICSKCGKLFADAEGRVKTDLNTVKIAKNPNNHANVVIDPAVPATSTSTGLTEGSHCSADGGKGCGTVIVAQEIIAIPVKSHTITYNLAFGQPYLSQKLDILEERNRQAGNPTAYNEGDELLICDLDAADLGFIFEGWYTATGTRVDHISADDTKNYILYAHWKEEEYSIQYNVFKTPVAEITDSAKLIYTVSKGLYALPNPDVYNYLFLGWYDNSGNEVTSIPAGSTGDRVLNAYFASKRNLAKSTPIGAPVLVEDKDNGVIYFAYEIGTIYNVPVSDPIWSVQAVSGLAQKKSVTVNTTISTSVAQTMSRTVASAAQNSNTWALSSGWNDLVTVNKEWADSHEVTQEEALQRATTESGTISITDSNGGAETTTSNDGTTTLTYDSKETGAKDATAYDIKTNVDVELSAPYVKVDMGLEAGQTKEREDTTKDHTGTDTTRIDTETKSNSSSWNHSQTASQTKTDSTSASVSSALKYALENKYGYSTARSTEGAVDNTCGTVTTDSDTVGTANTVNYSTVEAKTVTTEYSTDGKSEGFYRCVTATDLHVFGVVGYDIGHKAFFTYTYSVADGRTYDFLDYSPDGSFNDEQVTVLPFTIPTDIYQYVNYLTADTVGLEYDYDNTNHTAVVFSYEGESTQVSVPAYTVDENGSAYKVVAVGDNAFATEQGQKITDIFLGRNITSIGENAFTGCTNLKTMRVPAGITEMGNSAFGSCPSVEFTVGNAAMAMAAAACGAKNIKVDVSAVDPAEKLHLVVNDGESFTLEGGEKNFADLTIESSANVTSLNNIYFTGNQSPLKISSQTVNLYRTEIRDSADLCMILNAPTTNLTLSGTNVMSSVRDNALLAKSVVVTYTNSGRLKLTGNLLINGTVNDEAGRISFVDRGEIVFINDEQFTQYARGMFTVAFDPNGGTVSEERKDCYFGEKIGELPVPTRRYYDFIGWYTEVEGGELLTEDSALPGNDNITLYAHWTRQTATVAFNANEGQCSESSRTVNCGDALGTLPVAQRDYYTFLGWYTDPVNGEQIDEAKLIADTVPLMLYAHWEQKPQKGWALASAVPEGAQILDRKWSYSLTTYAESTNSSMEGFEQTGNYWSKTAEGSFNYSTAFPSGFDTGHSIYTSFAKSAYSAYENEQEKREASTSWAGYVYWHWMYDCGGSNGTSNRAINDKKEYGNDNGYYYSFFDAFTSSDGNYESSTGYCNSKGIRNYVIPERTAYSDCHGATRWFRFDYYVCSYADYVRMYQYIKIEDGIESTSPVSASDTISNVQEWVLYREK